MYINNPPVFYGIHVFDIELNSTKLLKIELTETHWYQWTNFHMILVFIHWHMFHLLNFMKLHFVLIIIWLRRSLDQDQIVICSFQFLFLFCSRLNCFHKSQNNISCLLILSPPRGEQGAMDTIQIQETKKILYWGKR